MRFQAHAGRRLAAALGLALATLWAAEPMLACSICRCGDPTFLALGTAVFTDNQLRIAFDWDRYDKEQGVFGHHEEANLRLLHGEELETILQNRYTLSLSYSFAERVNLIARVPWVVSDLTEGEERQKASGLSDPEFQVLVRLWSSRFAPGLGRRAWLAATVGVKTPWGEDDVTEDGVRLDQHVQPGTGSTDLYGGLAGFYLLDERSSLFASAQYRGTGRNAFGYRYGDSTLVNVAYERRFGRVDGVLELNYRFAERDQIDFAGVPDPNTGGGILYVTPRIAVDLGASLVVRAGVQIPTFTDLNGEQEEKPVVNAGLTFLF